MREKEQREQLKMTPAPPLPRGLTTDPSVKQTTSDGGRDERKEVAAERREAGGRERGAEEVREVSIERREKEIQGGKGQI